MLDHVAGLIKGPPGLMAGLMALLALIGTGITLADAQWARPYWLTLVPIYGVLCVIAAWRRTGQLTGSVTRQILHWLSVAAAIALDFAYLRRGGEPAAAATGLSSLLILALGSLLAGIHLEWLFALVGLLLFIIFAVVGLAQYYLTIAFLIAAAAALILAGYWAIRR
ncbi:MAG TPA: hypothetical protein VFY92_01100 [Hyphomicrobiaceae bacterium]|nr:hypothetical protein [Hyphomicrobiaceae bacterium]